MTIVIFFLEPVALATVVAAYGMQHLTQQRYLQNGSAPRTGAQQKVVMAIWGFVLMLIIPVTIQQTIATTQSRNIPPNLANHAALIQALQ